MRLTLIFVLEILLATALLATPLAPSHAAVLESQVLRDRFLAEAPKAWAAYLAGMAHVAGQVNESRIDRRSGAASVDPAIAFKIDGCRGLYMVKSAHKSAQLSCINEEYEFVLDDRGADGWHLRQMVWLNKLSCVGPLQGHQFVGSTSSDILSTITRLGLGRQVRAGQSNISSLSRTETIGRSPRQLAIAFASRGLMLNTTWLPRLVASPEFKITRVESVGDGVSSLLRVEFEYASADNPIRSGSVTVDPSRNWLVKSGEISVLWKSGVREGQGTMSIRNQFSELAVGIPFVSRQAIRFITPATDKEVTYETALKALEVSEVAEFYLPSYGIAAPKRH